MTLLLATLALRLSAATDADCAAHPACASFPGLCCPTARGGRLSCCSDLASSANDVVAGHTVWHEHSEPTYAGESLFTDPDFPPGPDLLSKGVGSGVTWIRASDLNRDKEEVLFGDIHPTDIKQGMLGDCWLIAGLASVAMFPDLIWNAFETKEVSPMGQYKLRLWDVRVGARGGWVSVTVDDFIPCQKRSSRERVARPLYASFSEEGPLYASFVEIWPMILEKAFAKFVGGYENLDAGDPSWAWQALARCQDLVAYERNPDDRWEISHNNIEQQRSLAFHEETRRQLAYPAGGRTMRRDDMFEHLMQMKRGKNVIASAICAEEEQDTAQGHACDARLLRSKGLVQGHQFSLLFVARVKTLNGTPFRLILQRNPWANELVWKGDWGPNSNMWNTYPEVKQQLEQQAGDKWSQEEFNGEFWMNWEDFNTYFTDIDVCAIEGWREEL